MKIGIIGAMRIELLSENNLKQCIDFEKEARVTEPGILYGNFDETAFYEKTLKCLRTVGFDNARTLLFFEKDKVIGRLDFCIVSSYAFSGDQQVYVDWIYVLKEYRHKRIAQALFEEMETYLKGIGIDNYFLIAAGNEESQRFYKSFNNASIKRQQILEKKI